MTPAGRSRLQALGLELLLIVAVAAVYRGTLAHGFLWDDDLHVYANPRIIGLFPRPKPHPDAPYKDFAMARGRFSSRVMQHWIAPGKARPDIVAMSYLNAGLRLFDISDPTEPKEVAYFVPPRDGELDNYLSWRRGTTEAVFIEWDRNLIWLSTHAGVYCLSAPFLGTPVLEPMAVSQWSVPHVNVGWEG